MGTFMEDVHARAAEKREAKRIRSEAQSTAGMWFWLVVALCGAAAVIMLTVKLGLVLFS